MIFEILVRAAKAVIWVGLVEELRDEEFGRTHQVMGCVFHKRWKFQRVRHDLVVYFLHVISVHLHERVLAC